jgi:hypothetical protein
MSIGDLSIFCNLLWFLSSVVCSFPCRGYLYPLLRLFLGIWFFWGFCKWNCFIISQSVCYWCIERLLIFVGWFCILLFAEAMASKSFWVEFLQSFRYKIMSSANRDSLSSSLLICIHFISSSFLIALARNSKTMLNRSREVDTCVSFLALG